jgi:hypothetical protein
MKILGNDHIRPFDVDETLITYTMPFCLAEEVRIPDPVYPGKFVVAYRNEAMIRLLKEERLRGNYTIVWSRSGFAWAETVILALGLESYVKLIMSKPLVYFDDTPIEEWCRDRVFIPATTKYKPNNP